MPTSHTSVFDRVLVDYSIRDVARISWLLKPRFTDSAPLEFQLQVSRLGGQDWVDVGTSQENVYFAADDTPRLRGQDMRLEYRVKLTTPQGEYLSGAATVMGQLSRRQWLHAREIMRRISFMPRHQTSFQGFLLKRRIGGVKCTACLDRQTGGITNSDCTACKGTGYVDGYFRAVGCKVFDLRPQVRETHNRRNVGTATEGFTRGLIVGLPLVFNNDIWVDRHSDRRYRLGNVQHLSEMNQIPLAVEADFFPLEFTHIAYSIPVEVS